MSAAEGTERFLELMCEAGANLDDPRYAPEVKALRKAAEEVDAELKEIDEALEKARHSLTSPPEFGPDADMKAVMKGFIELHRGHCEIHRALVHVALANTKRSRLEHQMRVRERDLLGAVIGEHLRASPAVT